MPLRICRNSHNYRVSKLLEPHTEIDTVFFNSPRHWGRDNITGLFHNINLQDAWITTITDRPNFVFTQYWYSSTFTETACLIEQHGHMFSQSSSMYSNYAIYLTTLHGHPQRFCLYLSWTSLDADIIKQWTNMCQSSPRMWPKGLIIAWWFTWHRTPDQRDGLS